MKIHPEELYKIILQNLNISKRNINNVLNFYPDKFEHPEERDTSILFFGPAGSGKTVKSISHMLDNICSDKFMKRVKNIPEDDYDAFEELLQYKTKSHIFTTVHQMLSDLQTALFNPPSERYLSNSNEKEFYKKYQTCKYLVIDDMGVEKITDWGYQALYNIINYRYEEYKTTVITTNLDPNSFVKHFHDDRLVSRLLDFGKVVQTTINYRNSV